MHGIVTMYASDIFYPSFQEPSTAISSVVAMVMRLSDGYYYDFSDSTFKDSGWTTKSLALAEKTEGLWVNTTGFTIPTGAIDQIYQIVYEDNNGDNYGGESIFVPITGETAVVSIPTVNKRTFLQLKTVLGRRCEIPTDDSVGMTLLGDALNDAQQSIIQLALDAYFLEDSDTAATVASQAYVTLPADMDWSNVESIVDETNDTALDLWRLYDHTKWLPDPSGTGQPVRAWFWQVGGALRLYLNPIPAAIYTLRLYFRNRMGQLSGDSDYSIIPAGYENLLLDDAFIRFFEWYNPADVRVESVRERHNRELAQFKHDVTWRAPGREDAVKQTRPQKVVRSPKMPGNYGVTYPYQI